MSFFKALSSHQTFLKTVFSIQSQCRGYSPKSGFTRQTHKAKLWCPRWLTKRCCSTGPQSHVKKQNFQDMMQFRRSQAASSVLIELSSKDDVPYVVTQVKDIGKVKSILSYIGEHKEVFLLTEFTQEESAKKFLKTCQLKNILDTFPFCSRLVTFERKKKRKSQLFDISGVEEIAPKPAYSENKNLSVSNIMSDLYETEHISELSTRLRFLFGCLIEDAMSGMFPECAAIPFGSSMNSFGKEGCDLDIMLRLCPERINSKAEFIFQTKTCVGDTRILQQRSISGIYEILRLFFPGITYVQRILQARIPILKFRHKILNLDCDISVNNMSGIYMSELLYFFGELDPRVRPLVFTVKKWAKLANITFETPGSWITNFSLTLLVIFFLQNRPAPILPPLCKSIGLEECHDYGMLNGVKYLEDVEKWKVVADYNKESLGALLEEFFHFIASFDFQNKGISLITGETLALNGGYPLWVQYPLDEHLNVSKNVSHHELQQLREMARVSAEALSVQRTQVFPDFETLFRSVCFKASPNRIDINSLYDNNDSTKKKKGAHVVR